jgi:hypothetical protein
MMENTFFGLAVRWCNQFFHPKNFRKHPKQGVVTANLGSNGGLNAQIFYQPGRQNLFTEKSGFLYTCGRGLSYPFASNFQLRKGEPSECPSILS